jgi:hypothetical protein
LYSVPARQVRPGQRVQVHIGPDAAGDRIHLHALAVDGGGWLATHPRATRRGTWMVDPAHWDGLPDGHTRVTTVETVRPGQIDTTTQPASSEPLAVLLTRRHADLIVAARPLADYAHAATARSDRKEDR